MRGLVRAADVDALLDDAGPGPDPDRWVLDTSVVIAPPTGGLATLADLVAVSATTVAELGCEIGAATDPGRAAVSPPSPARPSVVIRGRDG